MTFQRASACSGDALWAAYDEPASVAALAGQAVVFVTGCCS
jgi:hypothetical protein